MLAAQRAPDQYAGAVFVSPDTSAEVLRLRAELAEARAMIPAPEPEPVPRGIGEYRKSDRTPAEREAVVQAVLTSERINGVRTVYNSRRELVKWHSKPAHRFGKPTLEIWSK